MHNVQVQVYIVHVHVGLGVKTIKAGICCHFVLDDPWMKLFYSQ